MRKNFFFALALSMGLLSSLTLRGEEMIDLLKDLFKDKKTVSIGACEDVRELKYPGQKYIHVMEMTVSGKGRVVTPRFWGWFQSRNVIYLVHKSTIELWEEVISTPKELENGVIRTKFTVHYLNEQLGRSKGEYEVGRISSKDIFAYFKTFSEKYGSDKIEKDPKYWLLRGVKLLNRALLRAGDKIDSDGAYLVSDDVVSKNFPEMEKIVCKFRDFIGTEIYSRWEFGKGYTSIRFESSQLDQDTKESLAKLIYRTNPISVKEILPDGKRSGDSWLIDSDTIGGIVFDLGLDFDDVDGAVYCNHRGAEMKDGEDIPDEFALLKKQPMRMQAIEIPRDERSLLSLISRGNRSGDIAISFSPFGSFSIFDERDAKGRHLYYLKEAHMEGKLKSKVKRKTSLLKHVDFKDADLKIKLNYSQIRIAD